MTDTIRVPVLATLAGPVMRCLGPDIRAAVWTPMTDSIAGFLMIHDVHRHVSILAPGLDQKVAAVAGIMGLGIDVIAPFPGHERMWPAQSRDFYQRWAGCQGTVETVSDVPSRRAVADADRLVVERADGLLVMDAGNSVVVRNGIERARARGIPVWVSVGDEMARGKYHRVG